MVMQTKITLLIAGLLVSFGLSANPYASSRSDDKKVTREVSPFTEISLSVAADLYFTQGDEFKLVLEGDDDELEKIETTVQGDVLKIKHNKPFSFGRTKRIKVYVTMKDVEGLTVSGSGKIEAQTAIRAEDLDLSLSGSGDIIIDNLEATHVEAGISGSGDIRLAGNTTLNSLECDITGSGDIDTEGLKAAKANIDISGSGSCRVHVTGKLDADITGSGKVRYRGNPLVNADISGSGRVESY